MAVLAESFPVQEQGCFINKRKKVIESCVFHKYDTRKPSPTPRVVTRSLENSNGPKISKRRNQKTRKISKKAATATARCHTKPGLSRKIFHLSIIVLTQLTAPSLAYPVSELKPSVKEGLENHRKSEDTTHVCEVLVTDFPIKIINNDQSQVFTQPVLCPEKTPMFGSCSACFRNESILRIFYGKEADGDLFVEHGRGRTPSTHVAISSTVCKSSMEDQTEESMPQRGILLRNVNIEGKKLSVEDRNKTNTQKWNGVSKAAGSTEIYWLRMFGCLLLPISLLACLSFVYVSLRELRLTFQRCSETPAYQL
ncbi:uncharacterized protein LOC134966901 [Pseudophryne corroboree]|uniref:uncharacterized protein LOC134966901 n=1 Tax=Pseudophryne corroboree TaxID=495146 RepID=UPI003081476B